MSLAAVSKHLKVLEDAGLISRGRDAQYRPCKLEAGPLKDVAGWLENYRRFWEAEPRPLEDYLAELQKGDPDGRRTDVSATPMGELIPFRAARRNAGSRSTGSSGARASTASTPTSITLRTKGDAMSDLKFDYSQGRADHHRRRPARLRCAASRWCGSASPSREHVARWWGPKSIGRSRSSTSSISASAAAGGSMHALKRGPAIVVPRRLLEASSPRQARQHLRRRGPVRRRRGRRDAICSRTQGETTLYRSVMRFADFASPRRHARHRHGEGRAGIDGAARCAARRTQGDGAMSARRPATSTTARRWSSRARSMRRGRWCGRCSPTPIIWRNGGGRRATPTASRSSTSAPAAAGST